ncbi:LAME_0H08240g1_1 [Lachancea meyersii CBS 8951]|uniref:LAME_0H08240g1_1 n=1 Tax=Lachancea meyersii CBS 8951 TaxID=1266667 RepID=A0A1G4KF41_9SACH|nr:LAME_0H08240g1_1 [Lachancea meyersii CBS 8951]
MVEVEQLFSFQIFFIFLRESLEIIVIVSILLTVVKQALLSNENGSLKGSNSGVSNDTEETARLTIEEEEMLDGSNSESSGSGTANSALEFNNQQLYRRLKVQILSGGALGLLCCFLMGGAFIVAFYIIGTDLWSASEHYYEGVLSTVASVIISVMGLFFLRMGKLREKFRVKLAAIIYSDRAKILQDNGQKAVKFTEKYALFILPFVTALREGLEAVVFVGGVGIDQPLSSIPLSMLSATFVSSVFGYFFFKSSKSFSLQVSLVITTCFLYLIAAGLFSKGVWQFEVQRYVNLCNGQDMSEVGNGPGSYDISRSIWHVNCCNGERDGLWMIFTAIFGWTNSATYSSVIAYNVYWLTIIASIKTLLIEEKLGYIPFLPLKLQKRRIQKRMHASKKALEVQHLSQFASSSPSIPHSLQGRRSKDSQTSSTPLIQDTIDSAMT